MTPPSSVLGTTWILFALVILYASIHAQATHNSIQGNVASRKLKEDFILRTAKEVSIFLCLPVGSCTFKSLVRQFRMMDDDHSNTLELGEFRQGASDYGIEEDTFGQDEITEMFNQIDKDGSGSLDMMEFVYDFREHPKTAKPTIPLPCYSIGGCAAEGLMREFLVMDGDMSLTLDLEELRLGLDEYSVEKYSSFPQAATQNMFDAIDIDSSGLLELNEFLFVLKAPMSKVRQDSVNHVFDKVDKNGDLLITSKDLKSREKLPKFLEDLKGVKHPKIVRGHRQGTERHFFDSVQPVGKDGKGQTRKWFYGEAFWNDIRGLQLGQAKLFEQRMTDKTC